jgi:hypothetical protein
MIPQKGYHKWRWFAITTWVIVFTVLVAYSVRQTYHLSNTTHQALCTFTTELEARRDQSIAFLADHPAGLVEGGRVLISAAQLQVQIDNQTKAIDSLDELHCP